MTLDLLQELIRNRCVNDGSIESGNEVRSVSTIADYLGEVGEIIEPAPGRQSVVYRIPGSNEDAPSLLLLPHLDVVPANPQGWEVDPFAAEISDGFVWGRGAIDMLNVTASMVVVFGEYLRGNLAPLPGDLILAAVADEEAAGGLGAKVLVEEHLNLVDAPFVLTEVGYPALASPDGPLYPVAVGEKGPFWTKVTSRGVPGHGSTPYGVSNALAALLAGINQLFGAETPVTLTDEWTSLVEALGFDPAVIERLRDPDQIDSALAELAGENPFLARYFHAVTHLTISPNVVRGGIKANMIPDVAEAELDIRALPGTDRAAVDAVLRKLMGTPGDVLEFQPMADHLSYFSQRDNPLWNAIASGFGAQTGSEKLQPVIIPATTDARFFRQRGSVAYGIGLYDDKISFGEFIALFHGHNERVSVESVEKTTSLLRSVLSHFGRLTA
jgi:acetylornithine deacetylase/succinyl-diaminopimelate desuccinylase-like protein